MSVDPDLAETDQPYAYAGDNPVNEGDPTGLSTGEPGDFNSSLCFNVTGGVQLAGTYNPDPGQGFAGRVYFLEYRGIPYYVGKTTQLSGQDLGDVSARIADHVTTGRFGTRLNPAYESVQVLDPPISDPFQLAAVEEYVVRLFGTEELVYPGNDTSPMGYSGWINGGYKSAAYWFRENLGAARVVGGRMLTISSLVQDGEDAYREMSDEEQAQIHEVFTNISLIENGELDFPEEGFAPGGPDEEEA